MRIQRALKCAPKTTMKIANNHSRGPSRLPPNSIRPEEAALEEEGEDALGREQAAEDVADEARVVGPVHPELELLDDAGRDAQGEDQAVDLDPEERQAGATSGPSCAGRRRRRRRSISPSPIERGGKMKWKLAVSANWMRESSLSVHAPPFRCFAWLIGGGSMTGSLRRLARRLPGGTPPGGRVPPRAAGTGRTRSRADQDRDDAGQVRPLVAGEERLLCAGRDRIGVLRVLGGDVLGVCVGRAGAGPACWSRSDPRSDRPPAGVATAAA